jgi:hypothetical protein
MSINNGYSENRMLLNHCSSCLGLDMEYLEFVAYGIEYHAASLNQVGDQMALSSSAESVAQISFHPAEWIRQR